MHGLIYTMTYTRRVVTRYVIEGARDVRRVDHEDGDLQLAELVDRLLRRAAVPAGDHQVGSEVDDLLDVDPVEGPDDRDVGRLGREVGRVLDLAALIERRRLDAASAEEAKLAQDLLALLYE